MISKALALVAATIVLAGCASPAPTATPTAKATPSQTFAEKTPEQALADFRKVTLASCTKAEAEGTVEESTGSEGFKLVMVPKKQAYKDYNAAYFAPPKTYELIWEADAFSACAAEFQFVIAEDAKMPIDLKVEYVSHDGTYTTTQDLGDQGELKINYTVKDGLFTSVVTLGEGSGDPRTIRYGNLTDADWMILHTAVDAFMAEQ